MDYKTMEIEALEARKAEIVTESENCKEDREALTNLVTELDAINAELEARKKAAAEAAELRAKVSAGAGKVVEERTENNKMDNIEVRNTKDYIDAFAEYVKTGETRAALLTENATNGTVAVPDFVYDVVRTAWDKEEIMRLVKKAYIKGNLKVGFEISSSDAAVHTEGGDAVNEETLVLGTVELVPAYIKKWKSFSDEVFSMRGEAFLRYIYEEITYRIAKKAADELIAKIEAAGTESATTSPGVPKITEASVSVGSIAKALGALSDEVANPVVIMNKATWATFKAAQYANSFPVDPFEGLPVVFNNTIDSFDAADTGETYAIVGDLGNGALANFPNGDEVRFIFDELTLATSDLVKVIGKEYVGLGIVAPNHFVKLVK